MNIEEKEICWKLIARHLSGAITQQECKTLQALAKQDPAISEYLQLFSLLWKEGEEDDQKKTAAAFKKVFSRVS
jgi:hypothetical protein